MHSRISSTLFLNCLSMYTCIMRFSAMVSFISFFCSILRYECLIFKACPFSIRLYSICSSACFVWTTSKRLFTKNVFACKTGKWNEKRKGCVFKSLTSFDLNATFLEWCVLCETLPKMQDIQNVLVYLHRKTMENQCKKQLQRHPKCTLNCATLVNHMEDRTYNCFQYNMALAY